MQQIPVLSSMRSQETGALERAAACSTLKARLTHFDIFDNRHYSRHNNRHNSRHNNRHNVSHLSSLLYVFLHFLIFSVFC